MDLICTPEEAANLTGTSLSEPQLVQAQGIIEVFCGRPWEGWAALALRDQRLLKTATAYQAAWMQAHPEALTAMHVQSFSQLDQSMTFADSEAQFASPLAKRVLRGLSWRRTRSLTSTSDFQDRTVDPDHEGYWSPL